MGVWGEGWGEGEGEGERTGARLLAHLGRPRGGISSEPVLAAGANDVGGLGHSPGVGGGEAHHLRGEMADLRGLSIRGLMTIGAFLPDPEDVRPCFRQLRQIRNEIEEKVIPGVSMEHLSMGMTNDFEVAIKEGATIVRVGRAIFGERG